MPRHHRKHPHPRHVMHMSPAGHHRGRGRGRGRGERGRVHRGEVRAAVLHLLGEEAMHGYQIMQEIQQRSDGAWQPSPGSIYPTLQQLADEDLVASATEGGKNIFSLTDQGREATAALDDAPPWERLSEDQSSGARSIRTSVIKLVAAAKLVGGTGDETQIEAAAEILNDARKRIYALLASDE
jgi:DNA-binding PadR family transcriptional regulator